MSSNKSLPLKTLAAIAIAIGGTSCDTRDPQDPRAHLLGIREYRNDALGFTLRYPGALSIKATDTDVAGSPEVTVKLIYPGTEDRIFSLVTHDPAMSGHIRQYMVPGSERPRPVGDQTGTRFLIDDQSSDEPGATIQHITIEHRGKLYVMTGKGETFDKIVNSFHYH